MIWIAPSEKDDATATLEKRLWDAADQFRANSGLKSQEYSAPVLGLIFLRFAAQRARLEKSAAIKLHTLLTLRGNFPTVVILTTGKVHDVNILDDLSYEAGSFYIVDRGYLEGRKEVALAMKRLKGWTSAYTLNPGLPAGFFRALARSAGVHVYSDRDDTFYVSRSCLCLNADGAGERTLHFPKAVDLYDPFTGLCLAQRATKSVHPLRDKETIILRYAER
jgi:hypothetical protein